MANWLREYRLLAGVPGQDGFLIGQTVIGRALHINFDLEKSDTESSNTGKITISNLSDEHKSILNEKGCVVELMVGYEGNINSIFVGGVESTTEILTNADRDLEIDLIDGFSNYDKPGSISMNGIVTCSMVLAEIQAQMGIESVVITPAAEELLETAKYDAGYCYVGKMKMALQNVCQKAGTTFTLQGGVLQIYVDGEPVTAEVYVLNSHTGLISIPKKITISQNGRAISAEGGTSTSEKGIPGYEVEYMINGAIGINDLIQLESRTLSGLFRVYSQHYVGDNYGTDWKCTAQLLEVVL